MNATFAFRCFLILAALLMVFISEGVARDIYLAAELLMVAMFTLDRD